MVLVEMHTWYLILRVSDDEGELKLRHLAQSLSEDPHVETVLYDLDGTDIVSMEIRFRLEHTQPENPDLHHLDQVYANPNPPKPPIEPPTWVERLVHSIFDDDQ